MRIVRVMEKGKPDPIAVLRFSEKEWVRIRGAMKRDGKRTIGSWVNWLLENYPGATIPQRSKP
jgi:hypothetical protein